VRKTLVLSDSTPIAVEPFQGSIRRSIAFSLPGWRGFAADPGLSDATPSGYARVTNPSPEQTLASWGGLL